MKQEHIKSSLTDPIRIAELHIPGCKGLVGLTFCPGKKDPQGHFGHWDRDLLIDCRAIRDWKASLVLTLMERHELQLLQVPELPVVVGELGMIWRHLPIQDQRSLDRHGQDQWNTLWPELCGRLDAGERILLHCRGGLGRTGMIAALILVEYGLEAAESIQLVRQIRPGAIETEEQEQAVRQYRPARVSSLSVNLQSLVYRSKDDYQRRHEQNMKKPSG